MQFVIRVLTLAFAFDFVFAFQTARLTSYSDCHDKNIITLREGYQFLGTPTMMINIG